MYFTMFLSSVGKKTTLLGLVHTDTVIFITGAFPSALKKKKNPVHPENAMHREVTCADHRGVHLRWPGIQECISRQPASVREISKYYCFVVIKCNFKSVLFENVVV